MKKHELLAPAGSLEICKAVIASGADAVYLGGEKYGARAFAQNFSRDEVLAALDLAHLYGRKIFLTVNTLLKNRETGRELFSYIKPYYERGLDAVIVQDYGVFQFLKRNFPDLPLHVSTQASVCNVYGAQFFLNQGAARIVPSRELSLPEIRRIYNETGAELECFVHGALCYSYSGQCLMSSLLGGRSGNRGRCAQPCRLAYEVIDEAGNVCRKKEKYPLSPKDLNTLEILPKLCEAGIYSFKIEGRMKSLEYAAGVTGVYRRYLDLYEQSPDSYVVAKEDLQYLFDLGNRNGFTKGYYEMRSGRAMMTLTESKHTSANAKEVYRQAQLAKIPVSGKVRMCVGEPIRLELFPLIDGTNEVKNARNALKENVDTDCTRIDSAADPLGNMFENVGYHCLTGKIDVTVSGAEVAAAQSRPLSSDDVRSRFSKTGDTPFEIKDLEVVLEGNCFVPVGQMNELRRQGLTLLQEQMLAPYWRDASEIQYDDSTEVQIFKKECEPEKAQIFKKECEPEKTQRFKNNCELAKTQILKEDYKSEKMQVPKDDYEEVRKQERLLEVENASLKHAKTANYHSETNQSVPILDVWVSNLEQLKTVLDFSFVDTVTLDFANLISVVLSNDGGGSAKSHRKYLNEESTSASLKSVKVTAKETSWDAEVFAKRLEAYRKQSALAGKRVAFAMPHVFRENSSEIYSRKECKEALSKFDYIWVRTYDELDFLMQEEDLSKIALDDHLYVLSEDSANAFLALGAIRYTASPELNRKELRHMPNAQAEFPLYGYAPMMISAQCVYKNYVSCNRKEDYALYLRDRYLKKFFICRNCADCYNVIYNSQPLYLLHQADEVKKLGFGSYRIRFVNEDAGTVRRVLWDYKKSFLDGEAIQSPTDDFTTGHFHRGVD